MSRPSSTVAGPCLRMARSGGGATTWVVTVEVSSFGVWSWGTLAVLVTVPTAFGWTVTVTGAALAPGASVPTLHLIWGARNEHPGADTNVVLAGTSSVKVTLGTVTRPVFFTVMV